MPPRALLIGSGYGGLPVDASVDRVAAWLLASAFAPGEILRLTGAAATRDEILRGLARLAAHSHGDRPVVVYYAGHGYLYRTGGDADGFDHRATPLIVPIGLRRTAAGIRYGLLGSEFSAALQTIAARARNLSVILDCCHAGAMLHLDLEPDLSLTPADTLRESTDLIPELGPADVCLPAHDPPTEPPTASTPQSPPPHPAPAPHVVVLTASSAGGRAYVDPSTNRLIFTDALLAALAHAPTWDAALADARGRVQTIFPAQQPGLFGPRFRRPLTLHEQLPDGELFHVELDADCNLVLQAGAARDLHECDEFDLLDLATTTYGPGDILATARPTSLRVDRCQLLTDTHAPPRRNCYARRSRRGHPPAIDLRPLADTALHALLLDQLEPLGLTSAGTTDAPLAGRLERVGAELHVRDHHGDLVHTDSLDNPNLDALRKSLRRLDRWLGLSRWLRADSSARPLRRYYGLEWTPTPTAGPPRLRPGDRLALAIHNLDRGESELHFQALRVRPDRSVFAWSGCSEALDARQRHDLSLPLDDPGDALPPGDYREWTFVAVANHPFAIHDLVTPQSMLTPHDFLTGRHLIRRGLPRGDAEREAIDLLAFPYFLSRI
jgi:hypothetical protein